MTPRTNPQLVFTHHHTLATTLALLLALGCGVTLASAEDGRGSCCRSDPPQETSVSFEKLEIPDVALVRMDGSRVTLRDELRGDTPVLLNFIFTTCTTICPVMSATFSEVAADVRANGLRLRLLSISIDPDRDTPARLREYAASHGAGPEWQFLTGTRAAVETIQKAFGAFRGSKFNHAPVTFLARPGTSEWTRIDGLRSASELTAASRDLLASR